MSAIKTGNFIDYVQRSGKGASGLHGSDLANSNSGFQSGDLTFLDATAFAKG